LILIEALSSACWEKNEKKRKIKSGQGFLQGEMLPQEKTIFSLKWESRLAIRYWNLV
jgi:hypothetical protein